MSRPSIELFPPHSLGPRDWGHEVLIAHTPHYLGKILSMDAGKAGGLQYHVEKIETFFLYTGSAWVDYDAGDGRLTRLVMSAGMSVHVPAGAPHRVTAITDCVFFEVSTPVFNDRVRCEGAYGEPDVGGLPSTRQPRDGGADPGAAGSKRCPGKNTRILGGQPLLQWSIDAARASELFSAIVVSTDGEVAAACARTSGCGLHSRQPAHATDTAPDYLWVQDVMQGRDEEIFCILRPTSPFRTASTIRRAYAEFIASGADSIRAVQPVTEHPGKMWRFDGRLIVPALSEQHPDGTPWHSSPTQILPPYYVQNASLEMAWTRVLRDTHTISGRRIVAFLTDAEEGFDINSEAQFAEAERMAARLV